MTLVPAPNAQLPLVNPTTGAPALGSGGLSFLQKIVNALNGTSGTVATSINQIVLGTGTNINSGSGNPNGVVPGNPGDLYMSTAGGAGTTLYVKESGMGTTSGWVGK